MTARLTRGRAMVLVGLLGLLLVATALPTWGTADARGTEGPVPIVLAGTSAAPAVPSAGLVVIVAALVLGLSGRATRIAALIGTAVAALLAGWSAVAFLRNPEPPLVSAAGEATRVRELAGSASLTPWPIIAIGVAAIVMIVSLVLPFQIGRWTAVGRRYERSGQQGTPAAATPEDDARSERLRAMDDWDAIGRGEDPSADPDR